MNVIKHIFGNYFFVYEKSEDDETDDETPGMLVLKDDKNGDLFVDKTPLRPQMMVTILEEAESHQDAENKAAGWEKLKWLDNCPNVLIYGERWPLRCEYCGQPLEYSPDQDDISCPAYQESSYDEHTSLTSYPKALKRIILLEYENNYVVSVDPDP